MSPEGWVLSQPTRDYPGSGAMPENGDWLRSRAWKGDRHLRYAPEPVPFPPPSPDRLSMLTGTLVRVRFSKQRVIPLYLNRDDPQWLEVAESLLLIFREGVGRTRGEIESEIDELVGEGLATLAHRGLAKILEDRAEFEVVADVPPESLREKVFTAAAEHRKALRAAGPGPGRRSAARRSWKRSPRS